MDYLIVVDYQSDAERKRIDYAIERWKDRKLIQKPKGTVIHFSGDGIDEFLDDLYSRLGEGKDAVHVFAGDTYAPDVSEQTEHLKYSSTMDVEMIKKFLNYIMNKLGGSYEGKHGLANSYTVYTKKGQAGIDIFLSSGSPVDIRITIRGYGDVVSFISLRIDKELKIFFGSDE